jgi:hypothetical protein
VESSRGLRRPSAARSAAIAALALASGGYAASTASVAQAAVAIPTVSTGGAQAVSYGSATLTGSVNPRGSDASYYFQYGPTKLYGGQTAIADAGAGTHTVHVSVAVTGLQPLTVYHYRLIAVNGGGAGTGKDATLLTTKVPLSLQVLASPDPVAYGGTVIIQGALSGTGNAGMTIVLQANPFPFTAGFQNVGNPELTLPDGGFSFPVPGITQATQFRVVTASKSAVVSPVTVASVAVGINSHLARTRRRHFVRIYGTVTPAEDGMQVGIMRILHGRSVLVAGTTLHHRNPTSSRFSRFVRVVPGIYRVLVRVTNGAQVSSYGQPLVVH